MVPTASAAPACSAAERAPFFWGWMARCRDPCRPASFAPRRGAAIQTEKTSGLKSAAPQTRAENVPQTRGSFRSGTGSCLVGRIIPPSAACGAQTGCRSVKQRIAGGKGRAGRPAGRRSPERRSGNSVVISSLFLVLTGGEPREYASQNGAPKAARIEVFFEFRSGGFVLVFGKTD